MGIVSEPKSIAENWYRVQKKQKKTKQGLTDRWLWQTGDVRPVLAGLQRQNGIVRWHRRVLLARGATGQFRHPQLPSAQIRNGTVIRATKQNHRVVPIRTRYKNKDRCNEMTGNRRNSKCNPMNQRGQARRSPSLRC